METEGFMTATEFLDDSRGRLEGLHAAKERPAEESAG
jgi:hypothetical protein